MKKQRRGFIEMVLGALRGSLSGNMLAGKGRMRVGEGTIRAGFLMPPNLLTNFEIQIYYQKQPDVK